MLALEAARYAERCKHDHQSNLPWKNSSLTHKSSSLAELPLCCCLVFHLNAMSSNFAPSLTVANYATGSWLSCTLEDAFILLLCSSHNRPSHWIRQHVSPGVMSRIFSKCPSLFAPFLHLCSRMCTLWIHCLHFVPDWLVASIVISQAHTVRLVTYVHGQAMR